MVERREVIQERMEREEVDGGWRSPRSSESHTFPNMPGVSEVEPYSPEFVNGLAKGGGGGSPPGSEVRFDPRTPGEGQYDRRSP